MFESIKTSITDKIEEVGFKIKEALERERAALDTAQFNDPIADQTSWRPLKPGGTTFRTHTLVTSSSQAVFKATLGALAFGAVFATVGVAILALFIFLVLHDQYESGLLFLLIFPVAFGSIGGYLLTLYTTPIVFDKQLGYFYKGRIKNQYHFDEERVALFCKLKDIVALQIISERVSSSNSNGGRSSFRSYEINLVLKDASRLPVIDHGRYDFLKTDAEALAMFLHVPLWELS